MAERCSVSDCLNPTRAKGMCAMHYQRSRRGPEDRDPAQLFRQRAEGREGLHRLVLYVEPDVAETVQQAAEEDGITVSAAAVRALKKGLKKK